MSPAHYIEHGSNQGIVAIPEWSNNWPTYYKDAAIQLIEQHVGKNNYEIVDRFEVVVGPSDPRLSTDPGKPPTTSTTKTEFRIVYRKKTLPPGIPFGPVAARPLPIGTGMGQGAVPAGGFVPGSLTGGAPMAPGVGPSGYVPPSVAPVGYNATPTGSQYPYSPAGGSPYPTGVNPYAGMGAK